MPRAADVLKTPFDSKGCQPLADLCGALADLLKPVTRPAGFVNHKPLTTQAHGNLTLENALVDLRNTVWLTDLHHSAPADPFADAATMCATLLFRHFPLALTLDDVRTMRLDEPNYLLDAAEVPLPVATRLREALLTCATKEEVHKHLTSATKEKNGTPQSQQEAASALRLLHHLAKDDAEAKVRLHEACAVFDGLLGWSGEPPELWHIAQREPKTHWCARAERRQMAPGWRRDGAGMARRWRWDGVWTARRWNMDALSIGRRWSVEGASMEVAACCECDA